jgi:hypothetical protein
MMPVTMIMALRALIQSFDDAKLAGRPSKVDTVFRRQGFGFLDAAPVDLDNILRAAQWDNAATIPRP